jgi:hypothetical protein
VIVLSREHLKTKNGRDYKNRTFDCHDDAQVMSFRVLLTRNISVRNTIHTIHSIDKAKKNELWGPTIPSVSDTME